MSHYMTALAMKQKGLKPPAKIVLYWLADHHNGETGDCFPSHKRLAELSEMTDRSVRAQIDILRSMGLIETIQRTRDNGSQTSNGYILNLIDDMDSTPRKNIPTPMENNSDQTMKNFPTLNLGNNNLGSKPVLRSVSLAFDEFWKIYPRKIGKGAARKAFAKAAQSIGDTEIIIKAAKEYKEICVSQSKDPKFIPHASTWLNQERWEDEIEKSASSTTEYLHNLLKGGVLGQMGITDEL